jgi:hypothetical protein
MMDMDRTKFIEFYGPEIANAAASAASLGMASKRKGTGPQTLRPCRQRRHREPAGKRTRKGVQKDTSTECDDWLDKLDAETKLMKERYASLAAWISELRAKLAD